MTRAMQSGGPEGRGRRSVDRHILRHRRVLATVLSVFALGAAGCSAQASRLDASFEPEPVVPAVQEAPVVVAADGAFPEQVALAEVYAGGFARIGRPASTRLDVPMAMRVDAVRSGTATMSFGCTGELLTLMDPAGARRLAMEYQADDDPGKASSPEWRDRVYGAMSAALPAEIMATDPSNAQACGDDTAPVIGPGSTDAEVAAALPRHLVPFYAKPALDRRARVEVLNRIAGSISTDEVRELARSAGVPGGVDAADLAREWLTTSRFATG